MMTLVHPDASKTFKHYLQECVVFAHLSYEAYHLSGFIPRKLWKRHWWDAIKIHKRGHKNSTKAFPWDWKWQKWRVFWNTGIFRLLLPLFWPGLILRTLLQRGYFGGLLRNWYNIDVLRERFIHIYGITFKRPFWQFMGSRSDIKKHIKVLYCHPLHKMYSYSFFKYTTLEVVIW